jgi:hypothetical protein
LTRSSPSRRVRTYVTCTVTWSTPSITKTSISFYKHTSKEPTFRSPSLTA